MTCEHCEVELRTSQYENMVTICLIRTPPELRGQGLARAAVQELINRADREGLTLALTPEPLADERRTSKTRLVKWYRSLGFVPNKGRNRDWTTQAAMIRKSVAR